MSTNYASAAGGTMRRGKIIQYNPSEGKGIVIVDGEQHPFTIAEWRGAEAPVVNRVVDVAAAGNALSAVAPVPESVLLNEKASELKAKLGGAIASQMGTDSSASAIGQGVLSTLSREVLIGYAVFFLATVLFTFISVDFFTKQSFTLYKGTGMADTMTGSSYRLMLWAAYLSVLVPLLWRNSKAWLATAIPLLVLLLFAWGLYSHYSDAMDASSRAANAFGGMMGGYGRSGGGFGAMMEANAREAANEISKMIKFGLGAYLSAASAAYLAFVGVRKYVARS